MANKEIKQQTLRCDPLFEIKQSFPKVKTKDNINILVNCPYHDDKNPSLSITLAQGKGDAGLYNCPSCGAKGTVPNLIKDVRGISQKEVMQLFFGEGSKSSPRPKYEMPKEDDSAAKADARLHGPAKIYSIQHHHYSTEGEHVLTVFRLPKSKRDPKRKMAKVMAYAVTSDSPTGLLKIKGAPGYASDVGKLLPYRYEKVAQQEKVKTLLIVEGQSTADSVAKRLGDAVGVMASYGGVNNERTDWTKLNDLIDQTGAGVILVPDRDGDESSMPSLRLMTRIANQLQSDNISLVLDMDQPSGFDLEDVNWHGQKIVEWLRKHKIPLSEASEILEVNDEERNKPPPLQEVAEPQPQPQAQQAPQPRPKKQRTEFISEDVSTVLSNGYFSLAGRFESMNPNDRPPFLFFNHITKNYMVIELEKVAKFPTMIELCPDIQWWNMAFQNDNDKPTISKSLSEFRWQPAVHQAANTIPRITLDDMLGRGLSFDTYEDQPIMVFSTGGQVMGLGRAQGKAFDIFSKNLKHRYTHGQKLPFSYYVPRSNMPANMSGNAISLVEAVCSMPWKGELDGYLMAGYLVSALIGGCLDFRPQMWVTGASGTGKTWMTEQLLQPFFGSYMKGTSAQFTKAGVQRMIGSDSLPFIIDEAESRTQNDQKTLDEILSIVRTSTQKSQAQVKANMQDGGVSYYMPRASFILLSNAERLPTHADKNRFVNVSLRAAESEEEWLAATSRVIDAVRHHESIRNFIITNAPDIVQTVNAALKAANKDDIIKSSIPESRMRTARVTLLMCALQLEYGFARSDKEAARLYEKMRGMIEQAPDMRLDMSNMISDAEEILNGILEYDFECKIHDDADFPVKDRTRLGVLLHKIAHYELPLPKYDTHDEIPEFDVKACNRLLELSPARFQLIREDGTEKLELVIAYNDGPLRKHLEKVAPNHAASNIGKVLEQEKSLGIELSRTRKFVGKRASVVIIDWHKFKTRFDDDE